jgi:hypothetical protein
MFLVFIIVVLILFLFFVITVIIITITIIIFIFIIIAFVVLLILNLLFVNLGISYDSCLFPQLDKFSDQSRFTVMMGGSRYPEYWEMNSAQSSSFRYLSFFKQKMSKKMLLSVIVDLIAIVKFLFKQSLLFIIL